MKFGIAIPTDSDSWRLVRRAEELGFHQALVHSLQGKVECRSHPWS
jgi:hypothetical protein